MKKTKNIRPNFTLPEQMTNLMGDIKAGQKMNVILNARVIEKTKSYSVLRVDYVFLRPSRRVY